MKFYIIILFAMINFSLPLTANATNSFETCPDPATFTKQYDANHIPTGIIKAPGGWQTPDNKANPQIDLSDMYRGLQEDMLKKSKFISATIYKNSIDCIYVTGDKKILSLRANKKVKPYHSHWYTGGTSEGASDFQNSFCGTLPEDDKNYPDRNYCKFIAR